MWKSIVKVFVLFIAFFVFFGQVLALSCENGIVDVGAKKSKVISRCGEPLYVETREEKTPWNCIERGGGFYDYSYGDGYYGNQYPQQGGVYYPPVCRIEIIEVWTYNFGSRRFMRELIFRRGILSKIDILGYGE